MGGHGTYVWLAYAISITIFVYLTISPIISYKKVISEIRFINSSEENEVS